MAIAIFLAIFVIVTILMVFVHVKDEKQIEEHAHYRIVERDGRYYIQIHEIIHIGDEDYPVWIHNTYSENGNEHTESFGSYFEAYSRVQELKNDEKSLKCRFFNPEEKDDSEVIDYL